MSSSLQGALASLRTSTTLLDSSLSILSAGTEDLPRLSKVLAQTRHFELLPSSTLSIAQESLVSEIEPEIQALISRVEQYVEKLERREKGLVAKWELQDGRLSKETDAEEGKIVAREAAKGRALGVREELKVRQLRSKKERLSYAVERLQLQAQQSERNLRKSIAYQSKAEDTELDLHLGD